MVDTLVQQYINVEFVQLFYVGDRTETVTAQIILNISTDFIYVEYTVINTVEQRARKLGTVTSRDPHHWR